MAKQKKRNRCPAPQFKDLGIVMIITGAVTVCAFFLPIRFWILLLGGILIFAGIKLYRN